MTDSGRRRHRCAGAIGGPGRDAGSLPLAMLLTLVGLTLSALLAPMVLVQISATRADTGRVRTLHAAQAGLDVALGHIRAARDANGDGLLAKLPCGPLDGSVGAGVVTRYEVTIDYLGTDPMGRSSGWVAANRIPCSPGGGTLTTPAFALLRAKGVDRPTGPFTSDARRSLQATYAFSTTNQNIAGGLIHVYKTAAGADLCMDAGSGSPAAGTTLQMRPCSPGNSRQLFIYDKNLNLALASSRTTARPLGMCLDAGTPHSVGRPVQFQPCADITKPQQQWSLNDSANFEGTANGSTLDGFCFNVQTPDLSGSLVVLGGTSGSTCRGGNDNRQTFSPEGSVGAGAAGASAGQLVNFKQFGRCIDVTNQQVGSAYMIVWPCKQAPDPANVSWNQKWKLPVVDAGTGRGTGAITTAPSGGPYCLQSPQSTAAGRYVDIAKCPTGTMPQKMTWTVRTDTGAYPTDYTITDASGYCLAPTDPKAQPPDLFSNGQQISKLVVAACNGSTMQKWNAPPNIVQSVALKDLREE